MNKVIYIGDLTLNVSINPDGSAATRVGDRLVEAAMLDSLMGVETIFVGEASADIVGDHIVSHLAKAGVDTSSVDRYSEGVSPVKITAGPQSRPVIHSSFPSEPINPVWPRINENDVALFGSYMVLDKRNHDAVIDILRNARARKAKVVLLPYFDLDRVHRITRVMPEVWDSLEMADMVIVTVDDLAALFPGKDAAKAFKDHILFYCRRCLVLDRDTLTMRFFDGDESWTLHCHPTAIDKERWVAGAVAGTARALCEGIGDPDEIMAKANETAHSEITASLS